MAMGPNPLGMRGIVVGEGDSYKEAIADVKSAIRLHIETFGDEVLPNDSPLIEAFIAEATISACWASSQSMLPEPE